MTLILLHDYDFIEGFIAMLVLPFFSFFFHHINLYKGLFKSILIISGGWILTWFSRKISVNLYNYYKNKYNWKGFNLII